MVLAGMAVIILGMFFSMATADGWLRALKRMAPFILLGGILIAFGSK